MSRKLMRKAEDKPTYSPARFQIKALDIKDRTFEGLAATWDLDLGHDVIEKGAFSATLKEWKSSGRNIPLLDSHNWFSVRDNIGRLIDAKETKEGLWTKWLVVPGRDGDEVLARLQPSGPDNKSFIDSMSIGYMPLRWEIVDKQDGEVPQRILKEIDLQEVSLVLFPMNPAARVDASSVKEFASAITMVTDRLPKEQRIIVLTELLQQAQEAKETEPPPPPPTEPVPAPAPPADPPPPEEKGAPVDDDGTPDLALYDRLRLRMLETNNILQ